MSNFYGTVNVGFSKDFIGDKKKIVDYLNNHLSIVDKFKITEKGNVVVNAEEIQNPNLFFEVEEKTTFDSKADAVEIERNEVVRELRVFIKVGVLYLSSTSTEKSIGNSFEFIRISTENWESYEFTSHLNDEPIFNRYLNSNNGKKINENLIIREEG